MSQSSDTDGEDDVARPSLPGRGTGAAPMAVVTERVRRFVKQRKSLMRAAEALERVVDRVPGPVGRRLQAAKRSMFRETTWAQLVALIDDLDAQEIGYWLAGGWGVDALLGRRTRRHKDIDIIIDDFARNEPRVRRSLLAQGFTHVAMDQGGVWMPSRSNFEDPAGQRIELLNIDWELVGRSIGNESGADAAGEPPPDLAVEVLTTGEIEGRQLHCLTAAAQLLFHTGFPLEEAGESDISQLRSKFGATR